jgi:L-serine/L-threonine ammonia-lyase
MLHYYKTAANPDAVHFYCSSGGNAGLACVHAANFLSRPSTVVVPTSTKPHMIEKIKLAGASRVVQHGPTWRYADEHMREVVMEEGRQRGEESVYVPPFDHPKVWEGNQTLIEELEEDFQRMGKQMPKVVTCSVGGGGLFAGIAQGMEHDAWAKSTLLALETVGADSLDQSLRKGEQVTLPGITSIATSLGAVRVCDRAFELASRGKTEGRVRNAVLRDDEACMGCCQLADAERFLVEPACGVVVSLCFDGRLTKALGRKVEPDEDVILVICGGQNIDTAMIQRWRVEYHEAFPVR